MDHRSTTPPVVLTPSLSGPHELYFNETDMDEDPYRGGDTAETGPRPTAGMSLAPAPTTGSVPVGHVNGTPPAFAPSDHPQHPLNTSRSNPALSVAGQAGRVKDMANRIDHGQTTATSNSSSRDRYRRPAGTSRTAQVGASTNAEGRKLQKRQKSPRKSPSMSFESSFSSVTTSSTSRTTRSQPHASLSPRRARSPNKQQQQQQQYLNARPLFGEITSDGKWNGNFELGNYGALPTFEKARRGSEGSLALGHGRTYSHQDISTSMLAAPTRQKLSHKRSRSDMDALKPQVMPSMPNLTAQNVPSMYPTPPDSASRGNRQYGHSRSSSRIPISSRRQSTESTASSNSHSRAPSAMSNPPGRRRVEKSPTRIAAMGKENPAPRSRYHPPSIPLGQAGQALSAKIVAPLPKTSPPLRSSRPRQPVSSATTSASRARAAERFQGGAASVSPREGRRPSEQWLGKPYDPHKERSRRNIPELNKINFEERRARIRKAITQSLKSSDSQESMKRSQSRSASESVSSRTPSRLASHDHGQPPGSELATRLTSDPSQVPETARNEDGLQRNNAGASENGHPRGLSVDTSAYTRTSEIDSEPLTAQTDQTMFEDDSPVLGRAVADPEPTPPNAATDGSAILLAPVTYQPFSKGPIGEAPTSAPSEHVQNASVHDNVMRMRERSGSSASQPGAEYADDSPLAANSPSDVGDKWGIGNGDQGSIRIMLDDDPNISQHSGAWSKRAENDFEQASYNLEPGSQIWHAQDHNQHVFAANGYMESPTEDSQEFPEDSTYQATPRKTPARDDTLRPEAPHFDEPNNTGDSDGTIARVLDYYSSTGRLTAEMLANMQHRVLDLHRLSANGGSDANMIQSLLESIMESAPSLLHHGSDDKPSLEQGAYEVPHVTPDTPPLNGDFEPGTVIVYGSDAQADDDEDDFEAKIRRADEEWERQQRGGADPFTDADDDQDKPPPPPKDIGYTPRSSTGPINTTFLPHLDEAGLRISTSSPLDISAVHAAGDRVEVSSPTHLLASPLPMSAPPLPLQPPPPPPSDSKPSLMASETTHAHAFSDRASSELSPRIPQTNWIPSGSSRPSMDSQRVGQQFPASQSMTSFGDSTRHASFDTAGESQNRLMKTVSPGPEQKRLLRRRHIVKELLDTENSYHQDLKIIEDIYKATCTSELVASEDKKVLFGNCDDVEKFALHFYDELRRAATQVYVPPKQQRFMNNKRSSFSTTQSDGTTQTTTDNVDDEKDRMTTIGHTFLMNLAQMEKVYGTYLKNHDAANQRLSAIQGNPTVKCWLDECHANASDITSAWNLDSLLVKPTQRVAKYPMLLKDLLEVTPENHPDYEDLQSASKDIVTMLTRINDAKKRADLVDEVLKGKRKDSDLRGGLSKAFGRRTEKLKERVGIAEAYQDMEFDELAHKFGGHFIRLQICMRDVQDYVHRADQGVALVNAYVESLELFTDLHNHDLAEITSKWRRYGQIIRELTLISFGDHKAAVQKRVLAPMIQCIKLHEGPQAAIAKRKKKIVDYAKCKSDERRGQKPDKKTQEASDAYVALNETLKAELPQLYKLTAKLVQSCLHCFLDIQLKWHGDWEKKLRPVLEASDIPNSIQQIVPAFRPDYAEVEKSLTQLSICNGTLKLEAANFLSPTPTLVEKSEPSSTSKHSRPPTLDSSHRTMSVGSESSTAVDVRRHSGIYNSHSEIQLPHDNRVRSNSSMSNRHAPLQTPGSTVSANRPWSHSNTPSSSFSTSRPTTANPPSAGSYYLRRSSEMQRSPRPESSATYFTARPEPESHRFSGLFTSAYPPDISTPQRTASPARAAPEDMSVLYVCASLFEFSIDKTRREAGYPYLQYVQGEVFDVVAQKGELWLAKNQDDPNNELGWIWEQHFIILSSE